MKENQLFNGWSRLVIFATLTYFLGLFHAQAIEIIGKDDRKGSNDPLVGRISGTEFGLTGYCTGTLLANNCMVTAAHCEQYMDIVEFDVPRSHLGKAQPGSRKKRFEIDKNSIVQTSGQDWMVFQLKRNRITKLSAAETQGGYVDVDYSTPKEGDLLGIFGYGISENQALSYSQKYNENEVIMLDNRNHAYPIRYLIDTTSGDSGAGLRIPGEKVIVGIHNGSTPGIEANIGIFFTQSLPLRRAINACTGINYQHALFNERRSH